MPERLRRLVRAIPFKFMILMVILMAIVKEQYPFSHFPMYSNFENYTYYVYVADETGKALPMQTMFGTRTSVLKKVYDRELKTVARKTDKGRKNLSVEERRPAAEYALRFLEKKKPDDGEEPSYKGLRLYQVNIREEKGRIVKEELLVGQI